MTAVEALRDIADAIKAVFPLAEVWMRAEADACFSVRLPGVRPLVWVRFYAYRFPVPDIANPSWWYVIEESWPDMILDDGDRHRRAVDSGSQALMVATRYLRRLAGNNSQDSG